MPVCITGCHRYSYTTFFSMMPSCYIRWNRCIYEGYDVCIIQTSASYQSWIQFSSGCLFVVLLHNKVQVGPNRLSMGLTSVDFIIHGYQPHAHPQLAHLDLRNPTGAELWSGPGGFLKLMGFKTCRLHCPQGVPGMELPQISRAHWILSYPIAKEQEKGSPHTNLTTAK